MNFFSKMDELCQIDIYVYMAYNCAMEKVELGLVRKDLKKIPLYIVKKLQRWAEQVEMLGLSEVRRSPGWHDEPLKGERKGQRSIRLSKAYRAIYKEDKTERITIVLVIEVNKHKY